jgi:hypothetical protein
MFLSVHGWDEEKFVLGPLDTRILPLTCRATLLGLFALISSGAMQLQ